MLRNDLNQDAKEGWEAIKQSVNKGIVFTKKYNENGFKVENNFPKK